MNEPKIKKAKIWFLGFIGIFAILIGLVVVGGLSKKEPSATITADTETTQTKTQKQPAEEKIATTDEEAGQVLGQSIEGERAIVARIIDGDTIELASGEKVRLIGIDTPEKGRPYYQEAADKLKELIAGKEVLLEKDISERDKYGRLLRYVWLDETMINLEMVRQGYAKAYTYPPDVKYDAWILAAEKEARDNQAGLWSP